MSGAQHSRKTSWEDMPLSTATMSWECNDLEKGCWGKGEEDGGHEALESPEGDLAYGR